MAKDSTSKRGPRPAGTPVSFVVDDPAAKEVVVTGDFTSWRPEGIRLARGADGKWRGTVTLAPGSYQYRLRIDGAWKDDPRAQGRTPNPYGGENGVLTVS